jgi:hypothetical protein
MNYELRSTYIIIGALVALLLVRTCGNASPAVPPLPQGREVVFLHDTVYIQPPAVAPTVVVRRVAAQPTVVHLHDTVYVQPPAVAVADTVRRGEKFFAPTTAPDTVATVPEPFPIVRSPFPEYELGIYGTLGTAQLAGNIASGSMRPAAIAAGVGADFSWYFARHWGVGIGVEAAFPNVRLFDGEIDRALQGSDATSTLHKRTTYINAAYLRLPLWLRFRAPVRRHWFYAAAGASFDIALAGRYRTETELYTGDNVPPQVGETSGSLSFGHGVSLAAETGFRWTLARHWGLYTGAYATYGLLDVLPTGTDVLRDVQRLNLLQAGVKVGITIND